MFVFCLLAVNGFRASGFRYPYYFKTGDAIILNCWVPDGYIFLNWTHPSGDFIINTNGRYLVEFKSLTVDLTINNATSTDTGEYTCNARKKKFLLG